MSAPKTPATVDPVRVRIARHFRDQITSGVLRDGQTLPPTRTLATEWGVSGFTVSEAMQILGQEGLVKNVPGSGRVVSAPSAIEGRISLSQPTALLIGGFPGTGKTELARILSRRTGWAILDKDTITRPLTEAALVSADRSPHDRDSDYYLDRLRPREYEALLAAVQENLECHTTTIASAPFVRELSDEKWIDRMRTRFAALGAAVQIVWVHCDLDTMHDHIRSRGAARDAAKLDDWAAYVAGLNHLQIPAGPHHLIQNSADSPSLQDQADHLIKALTGGSDVP